MYCIDNFFCRIFLHAFLSVPYRDSKLECWNLKWACLNSISHKTSITGCITLYSTTANKRKIICKCNSKLCRRHRTYICRNSIFVCYINIIANSILRHHWACIHSWNLNWKPHKIRKSTHKGTHHILIKKNYLLIKLLIITNCRVCPKYLSKHATYICNNKSQRLMCHTKL